MTKTSLNEDNVLLSWNFLTDSDIIPILLLSDSDGDDEQEDDGEEDDDQLSDHEQQDKDPRN